MCVCLVRLRRSTLRDWRIQLRSLASRRCAVWQAREPGELTVDMKSEVGLLENSLLVGEAGLLALFTPSTDGLSALLKVTDCNVHFIQKHSPS